MSERDKQIEAVKAAMTQGVVLRDRIDAMAVRLNDTEKVLNVSLGELTDVTSNLMERVKKLEKLLNPLSAERKCAEKKTSGRFRIEVMKNKSFHWKQWDSYPEFEHSRQWADSYFQNTEDELIAVRIVTATKDGPDELVYLKRKVE